MNAKYSRFIVGTKNRPTYFFMKGGEMSEDIEDAEIFKLAEDAELEIQKCDEPDKLRLYDATITVCNV